MVNFQQTPGPRNYLSRRQQWRVLLLVLSLGLVVYLMSEARNPANWAWFSALADGQRASPGGLASAEGPPVDTRLDQTTPKEEIPGAFSLPAAPTAPEEDTHGRGLPGVDPAWLEPIRDNTKSRFAERGAWFHLMGILERTDEAVLRRGSTGRVGFRQLFDQPKAYRGRLVTVRGTLRRAHRLSSPQNEHGIRHCYQLWLSPDDNPSSPMVVYCLHLPKGFPTGMQIVERAEVTGFFFKRWAYWAQDTTRVAPVLLARTLDWQQAPPTPKKQPVGLGSVPLVVGIAAAISIVVVLFVYARTRRKPNPCETSHESH